MPPPSSRLLIYWIILLFCLLAVSMATPSLPGFYFRTEDVWLLLGMTIAMLPAVQRIALPEWPFKGSKSVWLVAFALFAVCAAGHWLILSGYDATRDEQLAVFDAAIFASGRLVAPVGTVWRDHADALNTMFLYPANALGAWVSSYLPMNAAARALVGIVTGWPQLTGPLWTAAGALALWGCIRHLWPKDRQAPCVGMLLYALSGQIVLTGMTAYAMPGHLTLNLVWLWLFLQRRPLCDGLALLVGFVCVGLHQPLMHPLFAAPVLLLVVLQRQWGRAALYVIGYALIGAFWLHWPSAMWKAVQALPDAKPPAGVDYLSRLTMTVSQNGWLAWPFMVLNLARLVAWNHPLLLPLGWAGIRARQVLSRRYTLASALVAGIVLTSVIMLAILPSQGHGFGYRYLHGLIGSAILLAIYGWQALRANAFERTDWSVMLRLTSWMALLVLIPAQMEFAHRYYTTNARLSRRIESSGADYAVVRERGAIFAADLAINRPDLDNRPIRLLGERIDGTLARNLCRTGPSVALFGSAFLAPIDTTRAILPVPDTRWTSDMTAMLESAGCRVLPIPSPQAQYDGSEKRHQSSVVNHLRIP